VNDNDLYKAAGDNFRAFHQTLALGTQIYLVFLAGLVIALILGRPEPAWILAGVLTIVATIFHFIGERHWADTAFRNLKYAAMIEERTKSTHALAQDCWPFAQEDKLANHGRLYKLLDGVLLLVGIGFLAVGILKLTCGSPK